jgi:hypothetical protein
MHKANNVTQTGELEIRTDTIPFQTAMFAAFGD